MADPSLMDKACAKVRGIRSNSPITPLLLIRLLLTPPLTFPFSGPDHGLRLLRSVRRRNFASPHPRRRLPHHRGYPAVPPRHQPHGVLRQAQHDVRVPSILPPVHGPGLGGEKAARGAEAERHGAESDGFSVNLRSSQQRGVIISTSPLQRHPANTSSPLLQVIESKLFHSTPSNRTPFPLLVATRVALVGLCTVGEKRTFTRRVVTLQRDHLHLLRLAALAAATSPC